MSAARPSSAMGYVCFLGTYFDGHFVTSELRSPTNVPCWSMSLEVHVATRAEEVGLGARVDDGHDRLAVDVAQAEAHAPLVRIARHGADHETGKLHLLVRMRRELARPQRRGRAAGNRRVEQEDGEGRSDGERDHEPRGTPLSRHVAILARGLGLRPSMTAGRPAWRAAGTRGRGIGTRRRPP